MGFDQPQKAAKGDDGMGANRAVTYWMVSATVVVCTAGPLDAVTVTV
jgi:hypothetical protein